MDFDLSDEQREIQSTAKELLSARSGAAVVRTAAEARSENGALWQEVSGLGWPGIAIEEHHGGQGLGLVELCVILEQAGAALAPVPLLPSVGVALMIQRAGSPEQQQRWLPGLASGELRGAVGVRGESACLIASASEADVIVAVEQGGSASLLTPAQAQIEPLLSIDPLRSYIEVTGEGEPLQGDVATGALTVAVAVAAESVGVCQRALEMSVSYVKERKQFDTPVGAFQAVSHRCAEMLLHTEQARSAVYQAAWATDADQERLPAAARLAKALASEAVVNVTASAIQAHGGIGFTWEADVHWLYKRAQLNAELLGGATEHRRALAELLGITAAA
ncbi:MAG TPA: acyl-CoA dehydrogenase family protein [Solirubrobacteraceae bacterium]|jgi:alkylation response protein AidB-like acyl-CoA dehydrogenase